MLLPGECMDTMDISEWDNNLMRMALGVCFRQGHKQAFRPANGFKRLYRCDFPGIACTRGVRRTKRGKVPRGRCWHLLGIQWACHFLWRRSREGAAPNNSGLKAESDPKVRAARFDI